MEHKIVEKEEFLVVGMPVKVSLKDPGYQKKIMDLWKGLMPRVAEIKNRKTELFYGLCNISEGIEGDECSFETIAGVEVNSADEIPEGMKAQKVPAAKYFVVTHKGRVEKLGETYCEIEKEMKKLNLKEDRSKIFFELYDERFKEDSDDSAFDIYSALT
ncbi:MAG: AraC family transcriptional regulator [bacterium]|nr:AraC family transcriptional regulator [bacterium]